MGSKRQQGMLGEIRLPDLGGGPSMFDARSGRSGNSALTAWESFWYALSCIPLGAGYFAKIPAKRAMEDFGMTSMTAAERFWYVLMCIPLGAGYFAKIPVAKALSELPINSIVKPSSR